MPRKSREMLRCQMVARSLVRAARAMSQMGRWEMREACRSAGSVAGGAILSIIRDGRRSPGVSNQDNVIMTQVASLFPRIRSVTDFSCLNELLPRSGHLERPFPGEVICAFMHLGASTTQHVPR